MDSVARPLWLVFVALAAIPLASAVQETVPKAFPLVEVALHPSATTGHPPGFAGEVPLMTAAAGSPGQAVFVPLGGAVGLDAGSAAWVSESIAGATYRLATDAPLTLSFDVLHVAALASFTVELQAIDPAGHTRTLGSTQRTFNLPRLVASEEEFLLPVAGEVIARGEALRLTVRADALDVLAILRYGAGTDTGLAVTYRLLDTDGDGLPDDIDPCVLDADCDGDTVIDGDVAHNNATYRTTYTNWYNATPGAGPPGSPTAPGSPAAPGAPLVPDAPATPPALTSADGEVSQRSLRRIEATAGGMALATGSTVTTLCLLRRRP